VCTQSFALWQKVTIEFTHHDHSLIACSRHIYGVVLRAHPICGKSHIQRNANGEVATILLNHTLSCYFHTTLQINNLLVYGAGELFKPSKDSTSLLVCNEKEGFQGLGVYR